ncbi:hypothetical protein C8Q73DRAFT_181081 [Cubamyces lactineus]|nr:hypothetical protein C8Q73DRAFT_181081 [Cubamyces lactineus]
MSDSAFNVWGAVAGAIGVLAIVPTYLFVCRMPTARYQVLKATLQEVEKNFGNGLKQGLIRPEADLHQLFNWLWCIQVRFDSLTDEVDNINSWREELKCWYDGLSTRISLVYDAAIELRKLIAKRSSRERRALIAAGIPSRLAELSSKREHFKYIGSNFLLHLPREQSTGLPRHHLSPGNPEGHQATATETSRVGTIASSSPEPPAYDYTHAPLSPSTSCSTAPPTTSAKSRTCDCGATSQGRRRLDWDADLAELLSAVLIHACRADKGRHDNQLRREMLRRFGTQLLEGLDEACDAGDEAPAKEDGVAHCPTSAATRPDETEKSNQDTAASDERE